MSGLYDSRWQKSRKGYLRSHPLCVECQKHGRLTVATIIDHIVPHKGDTVKFWNTANWQPMCKPCHDKKTASEDGGFGNAPTDKPGMACGSDGVPFSKNHHWNK